VATELLRYEADRLGPDVSAGGKARLGHEADATAGSKGVDPARHLVGSDELAGVPESSGSYRQRYRRSGARSGFRVRLFRLGTTASAKGKASVGKRRTVKRSRPVRWWAHPLFGDPNGRPPPHLGLEAARRMRSIDEFEMGFGRR